jgi:hypothetical protein
MEETGERDGSLCIKLSSIPRNVLRDTIFKLRQGVSHFMLHHEGGEEQASVKKPIITE